MSLPTVLLMASLALGAPSPAGGKDVLAAPSADSLPRLLAELEAHPRPGMAPGDAAFLLGQLRSARGEYRQAAEAFARAAGQRTGRGRGEARYQAGVSLLGARQAGAAREAFAAALRDAPERAAFAQVGIGQAYELERRPDKAFAAYQQALIRPPGELGELSEAAPAALERIAALGITLNRPEDARRARMELAHRYPASIEAARLAASPAPVVAPANDALGARTVQIGVFSERLRALALAETARKAGFPEAEARERAGVEGQPAVWVVRLGRFANADAARAAGEKAERALGVAWKVLAP